MLLSLSQFSPGEPGLLVSLTLYILVLLVTRYWIICHYHLKTAVLFILYNLSVSCSAPCSPWNCPCMFFVVLFCLRPCSPPMCSLFKSKSSQSYSHFISCHLFPILLCYQSFSLLWSDFKFTYSLCFCLLCPLAWLGCPALATSLFSHQPFVCVPAMWSAFEFCCLCV